MKNFRRQLGQGMTEYIIIVALIAVSAIGVYSLFGKTIRAQMAGLSSELSGKAASANIKKAQESADTATKKAAKDSDLGNYDNLGNNGVK